MDMTREIRIEEGKLKVVFEIQENGVVELKQFAPAGRMDVKERDRGEEDFYPITEVQITGRGTRGMHAYKHNVSGGATDFVYQSHEVLENEKGKQKNGAGIARKGARCCGQEKENKENSDYRAGACGGCGCGGWYYPDIHLGRKREFIFFGIGGICQ